MTEKTKTATCFPQVTDAKLTEVFDIVCENVGPDWMQLALCLGLREKEIATIVQGGDLSVPSEQCWEALCKWRMKSSSKSLLMDLSRALVQCRQTRVADLVNKLTQTTNTMDEILAPHCQREIQMLAAMYTIVDLDFNHWRNIAKHLSLNDTDILGIQKKFGDRTREKCMHALYKWRHTVPLHEYKISNLVLVLRACGLTSTAGMVQNILKESTNKTMRQRNPDEIFMSLQVDDLEVENYTPTPNSTPHPDCSAPRPKNSLPKEAMKSYVLNKIFFHLLDSLDFQDKRGMHPLVDYLHNNLSKSRISEVNRRLGYIAVSVGDKKVQQSLKQSIQTGHMSTILTQCLVSQKIKQEAGLQSVQLVVSLL